MSNHIPTLEQEKAFKKATNAILKCKKLGLRVYAKQYNLVAYTKEADEYADKYSPLHKIGDYGVIPYLSSFNCLSDSGADDYARYISLEDEQKFNPDIIRVM